MSRKKTSLEQLAEIEQEIAELERKRAALRAEAGDRGAPAAGERVVEAHTSGVGIGGDMTNSVAITGHVEGNVYVGPPIRGPEEALAIYCRVVASMCSHLPLRAVDVAEADPTRRPERMDLVAIYRDLETKTLVPVASQEGRRGRGHDKLAGRWARPLRTLEAAASNRRAVLLGDPGSGKSTFLRHVALCLAASRIEPKGRWLHRLPGWERAASGLLPIEVVLRDFAAKLSEQGPITPNHLWSFIVDGLHEQNLDAAVEPLHAALEAGEAIMLLDGLDEIPSADQLERVRDAVASFAARYEKSDMLVTCRTPSYRLPACQLAGMLSFELAPFDRARIDGFIMAWYRELSSRGTMNKKEADTLALDLQKAVQRSDLREIASNPLLLTVMALVHASDGHLPGARALLYERTVDLLLWRWDDHRTRRLRTLMDEAQVSEIDLKKVLWALAFEAHGGARTAWGGEGVVDIPEARINQALAAHHPDESLKWAKKMVEAMKLRAGLLLERKDGVYTFPHRTFQEYLAGAHLSMQGDFTVRAAALLRRGPVWREVILLGAGRLAQTGDTERLVGLLGELCPELLEDTEAAWRDVWMAGEVLAEVGANRLLGSRLGRDLTARVTGRLVELLRGGRLTAVERARAGDALGSVGDPRFRKKEEWHLPAEELLGFVEIPRGPFLMGSDEAKDPRACDDERPQGTMDLPLYYMARYPVTVAQFRAFVEESGVDVGDPDCLRGKPNHPVVGVSWEEAWAYADWLTEKLRGWAGTPPPLSRPLSGEGGKPWRVVLPNEAEWEKAARGTDGRVYPWGDKPDPSKANYADTKILGTNPVGCFTAGASYPYGCEEMSGNVWEWTRSLWQKDVDSLFGYPYRADDCREVRQTSAVLPRVVRGGSFGHDSRRARCAFRLGLPFDRRDYVGFRVAVSPFTPVL